MTSEPRITAVLAAYNAEDWIGETIAAILAQTRAPDEVIVVDDGSTDATSQVLAGFGERIRVVAQVNGGCPVAFNRAFAEASGDYVAMCGADDVWEPIKLERQVQALARHPQIDIAFGGARIFGSEEGFFDPPPEAGVLDSQLFFQTLYRGNIVCASSVLIRRKLYLNLGPFVEHCEGEPHWRFACDDYDYWLRALAADATFYYDSRILVGYRRHAGNATNNALFMYRSQHQMHGWYADRVEDRRVVRSVLARDLFSIARGHVDAGDRTAARATFVESLRLSVMPRAVAFVLILSIPERPGRRIVACLVAIKGALLGLRRRVTRATSARTTRPAIVGEDPEGITTR